MNLTGKLVGLILGVIFFPPYGVFIGLFLGYLWDIGWFAQRFPRLGPAGGRSSKVQAVFFATTFATMGYLAKSDGRVSEQEIQAARAIMDRFHLSGSAKRMAIDNFNRGKQPEFNIQGSLSELKQVCWFQPSLLRSFLDIQFQIAYIDGEPAGRKRSALRSIFSQLGVSAAMFDRFEQQYHAGRNYKRHSSGPYQNPAKQLSDAYMVLGVSAEATDAEIKKAYRKMMSRHHPDRLMSQGVPERMIKTATQKTQEIKDAYETVKAARGIK